MTSIEGISELHMSGVRAVFTTDGPPIDEALVAAAYEERGLEFLSLVRETRPRAEAIVVADAGVT